MPHRSQPTTSAVVSTVTTISSAYMAGRATADQRVVPRQSGGRYDAHWKGAIDGGADIVTVTSYNEWHEGTQIEPAVPHCFPDGFCSPGYEGSYGRSGPAAATSFLDRTREWADAFRRART